MIYFVVLYYIDADGLSHNILDEYLPVDLSDFDIYMPSDDSISDMYDNHKNMFKFTGSSYSTATTTSATTNNNKEKEKGYVSSESNNNFESYIQNGPSYEWSTGGYNLYRQEQLQDWSFPTSFSSSNYKNKDTNNNNNRYKKRGTQIKGNWRRSCSLAGFGKCDIHIL